ncbi:hypothetical protein ACQP1V_16110 [Microtetraspora malaysiensis]|uniref:hypothetical protein n=1 Tax=Microtetraspora malaysiensis TaxID=161358 RepID=UPI003D94437A
MATREHLAELACAGCGAVDLWADREVIECQTCGRSAWLDWSGCEDSYAGENAVDPAFGGGR